LYSPEPAYISTRNSLVMIQFQSIFFSEKRFPRGIKYTEISFFQTTHNFIPEFPW